MKPLFIKRRKVIAIFLLFVISTIMVVYANSSGRPGGINAPDSVVDADKEEVYIEEYFDLMSNTMRELRKTIPAYNQDSGPYEWHKMSLEWDGGVDTNGYPVLVYGHPSDLVKNYWKTGSIISSSKGKTAYPTDEEIKSWDHTTIPSPEDIKPRYRGFTNLGTVFFNLDTPRDYGSRTSDWGSKNFISIDVYDKYRWEGYSYSSYGTDNRDLYRNYIAFNKEDGNDPWNHPELKKRLLKLKELWFSGYDRIDVKYLYEHFNPLAYQTDQSMGVWYAWMTNNGGPNTYKIFTIPPLENQDNDLILTDVRVYDKTGYYPKKLSIFGEYSSEVFLKTTKDFKGDVQIKFDVYKNVDMRDLSETFTTTKFVDLKANETIDIDVPEIIKHVDKYLKITAEIITPIENEFNYVRDNDFAQIEIDPEPFNLVAENLTANMYKVAEGTEVILTGTFYNDSGFNSGPTEVVLYDGKGNIIDKQTNVALRANERAQIDLKATVNSKATYYMEINPNKDKTSPMLEESTYTDNATNAITIEIGRDLCPYQPITPEQNDNKDLIEYSFRESYQVEIRTRSEILKKVWDSEDKAIYNDDGTFSHYVGGWDYVSYNPKRYTDWSNWYYVTVRTEWTDKFQFNEHFEVKDINFRSKYTKNNTDKYGISSDGWVDMLENEDLAKIKAGYGLELQIKTNYQIKYAPGAVHPRTGEDLSNTIFAPPRTYTFNTNTGIDTDTKQYSGRARYVYSGDIPIEDNDCITLRMPGYRYGSNEDVFKSSYDNSWIDELELTKVEGNKYNRTKTYEFKEKKVILVNSRKYYVSENVADGKYEITVFTGNNGQIYTDDKADLNDTVKANITVYGSYREDIPTHILN